MSIFQQLLNRKNTATQSILTTKEKLKMNDFLSLVGKIQHLLEQKGIHCEDKVILAMTPSIETVATIMAIGLIGAAYVPVDIRVPKKRISYIINDTQAKAIITNQKYLLLPNSDEISKILIKEITSVDAPEPIMRKRAENASAYVIYTSGSTGNPKGVEVSFANLEFFIKNLNDTFPSNQNSVFILNTALQFDVSVAELYGWITNNASLFILEDKEMKDIKQLPVIIQKYNITHLSIAPSIVNTYGEKEVDCLRQSKLRYLLVAGEEFPVSLAKKLRELVAQGKVYNCYGPTEATVYATFYQVKLEDLNNEQIPIGKPFNDIATLYIYEPNQSYAELLLAGPGVAKGYLNLSDKTQEAFPVIEGKRYYKTGDWVSLNKDTGDLTFVGRKDFQIEINSIRVEPGEIENAITPVLNTDKCVVLKLNKKIVCFYLKKATTKSIDYTKNRLLEILPSYMIPSVWEPLAVFPVNINGKIDRKQLVDHYLAQNQTEENNHKLLNDIRRIIELPSLGMNDHLFDFGIDSLSVVELEIYLESVFSTTLPSGYLYLHPTVSAIQNDLAQNQATSLNDHQKIAKLLTEKNINGELIANKNNCFTLKIREEDLSLFDKIATQSSVFNSIQSAILKKDATSIFYKEKHAASIVDLFEKDEQNSYASSIFQRVYLSIQLNSFIDADFEYTDNIHADTTTHLIEYLVHQIEAFRTIIISDSDNHFYSEVYKQAKIKSHVKDVTTLSPAQQEKIIENDRIKAKRKIMNHLYGQPLYCILAHRITFNKIKLSIVLHHSIADGASVAILSKYVSNYFQKKDTQSLGMKVYLEQLRKNTNISQLLEDKYIHQLATINQKKSYPVSKVAIWEKGYKIIENIGELTKWQKFLLVADEVTQDYLHKNELDEITFQMLFDFRTVVENEFDLLVNDCHETVTYYRKKETNTVSFINHLYSHIHHFHYQKGISLGVAIYENFPSFDTQQQKLKAIVEAAPININYLGEVSEKNLEKKILEMEKLKKQLQHLKNQTRFTAFSSGEKMYIFQVSNV